MTANYLWVEGLEYNWLSLSQSGTTVTGTERRRGPLWAARYLRLQRLGGGQRRHFVAGTHAQGGIGR